MSSGQQARLAFQLDAESDPNLLLNLLGERQESVRAAAAMVNQSKRVPTRYAHGATPRPLLDAGTLDEPGGSELDAVVPGRKARNLFESGREALVDRSLRDTLGLGSTDHGVQEERARASAVGIVLSLIHI